MSRIIVRLGILLCLLVTTQLLFGAASKTVYEVDGSSQNGRTVTKPFSFACGEIANFAQPAISGQSITVWQNDQVQRYLPGDGCGDNSLKWAIVSWTQPTMAASTGYPVTFSNNTNCNSAGATCTGGLTWTQMKAKSWGAKIIVSPKVTTGSGIGAHTVDGPTILAAADPTTHSQGDCLNFVRLNGPAVTEVILEDCTATMAYDFGWHYDGANMKTEAASSHDGSSNITTSIYASFHPILDVSFNADGSIPIMLGLPQPWIGKVQDQIAEIEIQTGSTPSTKWKQTAATTSIVSDANCSSFPTITSATAGFTSTDVGSPVNSGASTFGWGIIQSVTNSTTIVVQPSIGSGSCAGTNQKLYIGVRLARSFPRLSFYSGTAAGNVRWDENFVYLISTKQFPNYNQTVTANPDNGYRDSGYPGGNGFVNQNEYSYAMWLTGKDFGNAGGFGPWDQDFSANDEGSLFFRTELTYLYNGASCGTANGLCAKAWQMLTGEAGASDTTLNNLSTGCHLTINGTNTACKDSGGVGEWAMMGNLPIHTYDDRGTGSYYCATRAGKNAVIGDACGVGTGSPVGRSLSMYAHPGDVLSSCVTCSNPEALAGVVTPIESNPGTFIGGWQTGANADHWIPHDYAAYRLTGKYFYLLDAYSAATWLGAASYDGSFFAYLTSESTIRNIAWATLQYYRTAAIAPDSSPERSYFSSMGDSQIEGLEGFLKLTGTDLTPSTSQGSFADSSFTYNPSVSNRWDWGAYNERSLCTVSGTCNPKVNGNQAVETGQDWNVDCCGGIVDNTKASKVYQPWMYNYLNVSMGELRRMGFAHTRFVSDEILRHLAIQTKDSTITPYIAEIYEQAVQDLTPNYMTTPAQVYAAILSPNNTLTSFNFSLACNENHGYPIIGRAAASYAQTYSTDATDANCPSGHCLGSATWTFFNTCVPRGATAVANGLAACSNNAGGNVAGTGLAACGSAPTSGLLDVSVKYDLLPESPVVTPGSIQTQNTIRKAGTVMQ